MKVTLQPENLEFFPFFPIYITHLAIETPIATVVLFAAHDLYEREDCLREARDTAVLAAYLQ